VVWYQGESNVGEPGLYRRMLPLMIHDWRRAWGQGDFPFLQVQLANFGEPPGQPGASGWAELREAQSGALEEAATGMAVAIDIGESYNIHPPNKLDVGRRLAQSAFAVAYGQSGIPSAVKNPSVPEPVAVRYAWADNPEGCNLYNKEGFPAPPFRSDSWPA